MKLFGNSPQEQAMQRLIHDTNSALSDLKHHSIEMASWLKEFHKENKDIVKVSSKPYVHLEYIKSRQKELQDAIDAYYEKFKNDFPVINQLNK